MDVNFLKRQLSLIPADKHAAFLRQVFEGQSREELLTLALEIAGQFHQALKQWPLAIYDSLEALLECHPSSFEETQAFLKRL